VTVRGDIPWPSRGRNRWPLTHAERMKQHNTNEAESRVMYDLYFDSVARYYLPRLPEHSAQDAVSDVDEFIMDSPAP
jgi:hypothetical protein